MENIFQPARFGKLFNKYMRENLKFYAYCALVFIALQASVYFFNLNTSRSFSINYEDQTAFFVIGMFVGLFIITVISFSDYNHPRSIFPAIMLPASVFEKFLLRWLVTLFGYTIVGWGLYMLTQTFYSGYIEQTFYLWDQQFDAVRWGLSIYVFVHSVAFLGAVSFSKRTVVTTALAAFLTIGLFVYLNHRLTLYMGSSMPFPFIDLSIMTQEGPAKVSVENHELWAYLSLSALTIILWITAYFKLKEREV